MTIIIIFNMLLVKFDIITISFLKISNMTINQIQNILYSKKIKNFNKKLIKAINNLAIIFKKNQ